MDQTNPTARVREYVAAWDRHGPVLGDQTGLAFIGGHRLTLGDLRSVLEMAETYEDLRNS